MNFKSIIKGDICSLKRLNSINEKDVELFYELFNEKGIYDFLNQEYTANNTKSKIRKWLNKKISHPHEVWYIIKAGKHSAGYICFKWRKHYDDACEISTAIAKDFRGRKLGYESSKILVDYLKSIDRFTYIAGYYYRTNKIAEKNLRKLGFRKANRLHKIITKEFYGDSGTSCGDRRYHLMVINKKQKGDNHGHQK